ncbi:hypothetical protein L4D08_25905 [Photobacterium chitinilyticum]|uniref:hypothetical protein n=1 Tax=Photobacterium chitinilyticum TaxID=2485123 RepID=UPI003D0C13CD
MTLQLDFVSLVIGSVFGFLVRWFYIEKMLHSKVEQKHEIKVLNDALKKRNDIIDELESCNKEINAQLSENANFIEQVKSLRIDHFNTLTKDGKEYCLRCVFEGKITEMNKGQYRTICPECCSH